MNELEAWSAGFLDGEGSFRIIRQARAQTTPYNICVEVGQNVVEPLELLRDLYGGTVYSYQYGPRTFYKWMLRVQKDVRHMLLTVRPLLTVKGAQADLLLQFLDTPTPTLGGLEARAKLFEAVRLLNHQ